eukprot:3557683-Prymnesium_polylepis.1
MASGDDTQHGRVRDEARTDLRINSRARAGGSGCASQVPGLPASRTRRATSTKSLTSSAGGRAVYASPRRSGCWRSAAGRRRGPRQRL